MNKPELAERFVAFAENECSGSSKLYEHLSKKVADDDYLLALCTHVRAGQPIPNMLFGAVHYLLLKGSTHDLRNFYPSIIESPQNFRDSFPYFRDFCREHKKEIITLLEDKLVQTNEVRRTGYLYPPFCVVYEKIRKPLSLIEIGTSAGLQLFWDRYSYSYGNDQIVGNADSKVHISTEVKGSKSPFLLYESPPVISRTGLDLHVNDLSDPEDYLWLKALIWPEHNERRELYIKAAEYVKNNDLNLLEGDAVTLLPEVVSMVPDEAVICVFHTHVANQMPSEIKKKLLKEIKNIGGKRDIAHIYNNIQDRRLHLDYFMAGKENNHIIGETDGHGRWFTWELEDQF